MMEKVKCEDCINYRNEWCDIIVDSPDPERQRDCKCFQARTNADRIREMTDEELSELLVYQERCPDEAIRKSSKDCYARQHYGSCENCWLDWLKREDTK